MYILYVMSTLLICATTPELNVVEVAYDHQVQVKNYVTEDLKLSNSYDTWYGNLLIYLTMYVCEYLHDHAVTKNVAKEMKKLSSGKKKERSLESPGLQSYRKNVCLL